MEVSDARGLLLAMAQLCQLGHSYLYCTHAYAVSCSISLSTGPLVLGPNADSLRDIKLRAIINGHG